MAGAVDSKSHRLALQLSKKFEKEIREGRAVDAFAHLLVNYIYRFFCISDRVPEYADRLFAIRSNKNLFDADSVGFMQECARNIESLDDSFLGKVEPLKANRSDWLQQFGQVSALIAEIVKSTDGVPIEKARVFVTYHFKVKDSENFVDHLRARVKQEGANGSNLMVRCLLFGADDTTLFLVREVMDFLIFLLASWIMGRVEGRTIADYSLPWREMFRVQFWQGVLLGFASITGLLVAMRGVGVKGLGDKFPNLRLDLVADAPEDFSPLLRGTFNSLGVEQAPVKNIAGEAPHWEPLSGRVADRVALSRTW